MGFRQVKEGTNDTAQVEISSELLAQLITTGTLTPINCRCIDNNARKTFWQSLLKLSIAC